MPLRRRPNDVSPGALPRQAGVMRAAPLTSVVQDRRDGRRRPGVRGAQGAGWARLSSTPPQTTEGLSSAASEGFRVLRTFGIRGAGRSDCPVPS